jgi:hypothetical protein
MILALSSLAAHEPWHPAVHRDEWDWKSAFGMRIIC